MSSPNSIDKNGKAQPPTSAKIDPWTTFPELPYTFIQKGFVHDSRCALKVNLANSRGGVDIKANISQSKAGPYVYDETRLWFNLPQGRSFYAQLKAGETLKAHYDNGPTSLFGKTVNLYTALSFNRQLNHLSWRVGFSHICQSLSSDIRLKLNNQEKIDPIISTRNVYSKDKFMFGFLGALNVRSFVLLRNSLLFGYKVNDKTELFLRAENECFRKSNPKVLSELLSHYIFDAIHTYDSKTKIGFQVALQTHKYFFKWGKIVLEREVKQGITSKVRIGGNAGRIECNTVISMPLFENKQQGKVSIGLHGVNLHKEQREFKWGTQFEINI